MKNLFLCILWFLLPLGTSAQWNAFVTNYKKESFGRGSKTWQIRAYDESHIYFANKNGFLEFNGIDWRLFPFENFNDVRSVCISRKSNRVYAGGEGEFGYFEPDERGLLTYTKLSEEFIRKNNVTGGYWGVYETDNLIYYISDRHIVKQIDNNFTNIPSNVKIDCSNIVDGVLLVGTTDGVKMLVGNTLLPLRNDEILRGKTVRAIMPFNEGFLIATASDGLFYGTDNEIKPFITGMEDFMYRNEIFSLAVSSRYIAVGTIHKGLLLLDRDNYKAFFYNEENGLQNNTVLSLCFDLKENLWLGLDNGIDYISLDSPFSNLYTFPNAYGGGYASVIHNNLIYLGTNRGLFYTQVPIRLGENSPQFSLVPTLSGQVWGLKKIKDDLFCLHDKGLYLITDKGVEVVPGLRGALFCTEISEDSNKCLVGTYEGLFIIERVQQKWLIRHKLGEINDWMKNIAFIPPNTIWIRALEKGMVKITFDPTDYSIKESKVYNKLKGFESIDELYLHEINGEVYFSSASGLYEYDKQHDRVIPSEYLKSLFLSDKSYIHLTGKNNKLYALSSDMLQVVSISPNNEREETKIFPFCHSQIDFIKYYESMEVINDSSVVIPNENGFALLNTQISSKEDKNELFIKSVYVTYPKDSVIYTDNYLNRITSPEIPYQQHALRFEYAIRSFGTENPVTYRVRLTPDNQWSDFSSATVKEYNNLKDGKYTFEVEALYSNGSLSQTSFSFQILPPWYRSIYAWIGYLILLFMLGRILYIYDKKRLVCNRKVEIAKKEKEMQVREQEFSKEKLEQELTFKSQEMANLMINFSRKNEILMSIKEELTKVTTEMKGDSSVKAKRMLINLNNSIDRNIQSDDALKRFEEQFNLVHNNFMKKLRERHPDLTVSELKMCAYIKMNLSSKEIAPLLNLSVRGIETLRYRLRKKIELEREDSLTEYLNKI